VSREVHARFCERLELKCSCLLDRKTVTANAKKIVQHDNDREKTKKYESIKNRMTDQPEQSTIGKGEQNEKVLFFTEPHFLFLIPDAHLAHCLLS